MRLKSGSPESRWRRLFFVGQETTSGIRTWEVEIRFFVENGRNRSGRSNERKPTHTRPYRIHSRIRLVVCGWAHYCLRSIFLIMTIGHRSLHKTKMPSAPPPRWWDGDWRVSFHHLVYFASTMRGLIHQTQFSGSGQFQQHQLSGCTVQ